jgi:hypothetical protein
MLVVVIIALLVIGALVVLALDRPEGDPWRRR